jgi:hypothetical protein
VTFNGGKPVYVPLHPPAPHIEKPTSDDWTIDLEELRYVCIWFDPLYCVFHSLHVVYTDVQSLHARR